MSKGELILSRTRSSGPVFIIFRSLLILIVWAPLPVATAAVLFYGNLQSSLPPTPLILAPPPGSATQVYDLDGTPVGGLHRGLAPWIQYDDIPTLLVEAFLAAEDDDFFLHAGVDGRAIVRAAIANWRAGEVRQGGSTITQQVAKMFVGTARTYERKMMELLIARRIEAEYTKAEIIECYLNRIYLGAGAYGIVAAARLYFDRSVEGLTLAQATMLAGIASAPSAFEPYDHPGRALERRDRVLARMEELGFASEEAVAFSLERPLELRQRGEIPVAPLPYVVDWIRRQLLEEHGADVWRYGALRVETPVSSILQRHGETALGVGLEALDRRQGYRGPLLEHADIDRERFDALTATHFGTIANHRPALVEGVTSRALQLWVDGREYEMGVEGWGWAFPFDVESHRNDLERGSATGLVEPGAVVLVEAIPEDDSYRLAQMPRIEGALLSVDLETGYLRAMVAGYDYDQSQFNRVMRGCRQPGSTFKPVIYSVALDQGMTLATSLLDAPIQLPQGPIEVWRPRNADADFQGDMLFRDALIRSRNLPTVRIFREVGVYSVVRRAEELGITTPMLPTDALSLGASCVYPVDLATVYGVFANGGYRSRPTVITSVVDGGGNLVIDQGAFYDGAADSSTVLFRMFRDLETTERPVIDPRTAYLMTYALEQVVRLGTAYRALELDVPAAGKTGTTNAFDAWYAGFTESYVSVVWVGTDRNTRPLGSREHGADVALPIWIDYTRNAIAGLEQGELIAHEREGVEYLKVDVGTGLLAQEDVRGLWLPFRVGTAPNEYALTPDQRDMVRADRVEDGF
jgi:penicillin-binding protein 1A